LTANLKKIDEQTTLRLGRFYRAPLDAACPAGKKEKKKLTINTQIQKFSLPERMLHYYSNVNYLKYKVKENVRDWRKTKPKTR